MVFIFFSFISASLMVFDFNILKYLWIFFSPSVLILSWFGPFFPSVLCHLLLFIISISHFSITNYIPISWLYILYLYMGFQFFLIFRKEFDVVHVPRMVDFFLVIYEDCIPRCISCLYYWVTSSESLIVMVIAHLLGRSLSWFSPL